MAHKIKKIFFISTFLILIFNCYNVVFAATPIYNSFEFETWSPSTFNEYANAVMGTSGLDYYSKGSSNSKFVNSMSDNYYKVMRKKDGNLFYAGEFSSNLYIDYDSNYGFYTPWMASFTFDSSSLNMTYERVIRDMQLTFANSGLENFDDYNSLNYLKTAIPEFYPVISGPVFSATFDSYVNETPIESEEIIPDNDESIYGYLWSPSVVSGDVEINLDYKKNNQLIHGEHFIGSALQSSFVFYYYSGDDIISFNDYVRRNAYLNTDYGTWYDFYIEPQNLEYLPNNTDFYLNIYATLNNNTATVVKDFLAFHTVDNSGGGTGGDTSGDTPNYNEKLDNIQSGINNIENKIPTSGEMKDIISNETDKIVGLFSGENSIINSGESMAGDLTLEQITEKIDFNIIDNPYQALWDDLLNLLTGAMLSTGNQTITFETRTGMHTVNSDDIKSPEELKTFLSIFSNTAVLMAMFIEIQKLIIKISEGNASYVLHMGDADMYFYDDCQLF